jgi:hypothetical protein
MTNDTNTSEQPTHSDEQGLTETERRGEWVVPLNDGAIVDNRAVKHDLSGSVIWMGLPKLHGWQPFGGGVKMPHQTYVKAADEWLADNPNAREIAVVDVVNGDWKTVWRLHGRDEHVADDYADVPDGTIGTRPLDGGDARATYRDALDLWGVDAQINQLEQEAAELIVAIKHFQQGRHNSDEELVTEAVQLSIMLGQFAEHVGRDRFDETAVDELRRLRERIESVQPETMDGQ